MEFLRNLDRSTLEWFRGFWGNSRLDYVMLDVSALGGRYVLTLVVLFSVGLLLTLRRYRTAGFVLTAAVGGAFLSWCTKELIGRPRPSPHHPLLRMAEPGNSFPSGHSMLSAVIYLTLALIATAIIPRGGSAFTSSAPACCWSLSSVSADFTSASIT